jgi:two-component system response regulator DesR
LRADWQNDLIQYYRLFGSTPAPHSNGSEARTMISVLIVADEQWAGPALSRRIASDPSIEVAGTVSSLAGALDRADARVVDVLLVHAEFWLGAETSSLARYRSRTTALPVIIVSQTEPLFGLDALLSTGVSFVCPLSVEDEILCEIIKRYAAAPNNLAPHLKNPTIIPETIRRQFAAGRWPRPPYYRPPNFPNDLTETEARVLRMLGRGLSTALIGEVLGIPERAVEDQISTIRRKVGVDEHADLRHLGMMGSAGRDGNPIFQVAIGDRNKTRRDAIELRLAGIADIRVLSSEGSVSAVTSNRIDVVILGTDLPDAIDLNHVRGLRWPFDFVPVLAIVDQVTNDLLDIMQRGGVAELVDRNIESEALGRSIRRVARGEDPIFDRPGRATWGRPVSPTEAECVILRGFRDEAPDSEIRRALRVGRWTYWQMRETMVYRLALKDRANAVRVAIRFGWIEPVSPPDDAVSSGSGSAGSLPLA